MKKKKKNGKNVHFEYNIQVYDNLDLPKTYMDFPPSSPMLVLRDIS